jgi:hypothetical protein
LVAGTIEQSVSPFSQLQARYHPVVISALLGLLMIALVRFRRINRIWNPAVTYVVISLCLVQSFADVVGTWYWNAYVADLRSRLSREAGLIPWERTLHTGDARADTDWKLFQITWVIPYLCVIFAPNGIVKSMIDLPNGATFRPLDPEKPDNFPKLSGVDFAPYRRALNSGKEK